MDDDGEKFENDDNVKNYRRIAESDLNKRISDLAKSLGVDMDALDSSTTHLNSSASTDNASGETVSPAARTVPDANSDVETAATLSVRQLSEHKISTQLIELGMSEEQADTVVKQYNDVLGDHEAVRALTKTVAYAANGKSDNYDTAAKAHAGHRKRLRASIRRDSELNGFSDYEILETLLSFVIPQRDTNLIAHRLLDKFGSLLSVIRTPAKDLATVKGMTEQAARIIPMLTAVCLWDVQSNISIRNHADAVDFFGAMYLGGRSKGVNAAYLDAEFGLIAVEKVSGTHIEKSRAIVGSVYKYSAEYVIVAYCSFDMFPEKYNTAEFVDILRCALKAVDARLIDCLIFGATGYYTLGTSVFTEGAAHFEYIPLVTFSRSPELVNRLIEITLSEQKEKQRKTNGSHGNAPE